MESSDVRLSMKQALLFAKKKYSWGIPAKIYVISSHLNAVRAFPGSSLGGFDHVPLTVQSNSLLPIHVPVSCPLCWGGISRIKAKIIGPRCLIFTSYLHQKDFHRTNLDTDKGTNENT